MSSTVGVGQFSMKPRWTSSRTTRGVVQTRLIRFPARTCISRQRWAIRQLYRPVGSPAAKSGPLPSVVVWFIATLKSASDGDPGAGKFPHPNRLRSALGESWEEEGDGCDPAARYKRPNGVAASAQGPSPALSVGKLVANLGRQRLARPDPDHQSVACQARGLERKAVRDGTFGCHRGWAFTIQASADISRRCRECFQPAGCLLCDSGDDEMVVERLRRGSADSRDSHQLFGPGMALSVNG